MDIQHFTVEIKNYRGFSDEEPVVLSVSPGFTAFVGPNNSGKSSLLRFFYEMRTVFDLFQHRNGLDSIRSSDKALIDFSPLGVEDKEEVFHDGNERDLQIRFDFPHASLAQVGRLDLTISRRNFSVSGTSFVPLPSGELSQIIALDFNPVQVRAKLASGDIIEEVDTQPLAQTFEALRRSLYVGPSRNLIGVVAGIYYDLSIGGLFAEQWNEWKTGDTKARRVTVQRVTEDISRIFGYRSLEISATKGGKSLQVVV